MWQYLAAHLFLNGIYDSENKPYRSRTCRCRCFQLQMEREINPHVTQRRRHWLCAVHSLLAGHRTWFTFFLAFRVTSTTCLSGTTTYLWSWFSPTASSTLSSTPPSIASSSKEPGAYCRKSSFVNSSPKFHQSPKTHSHSRGSIAFSTCTQHRHSVHP